MGDPRSFWIVGAVVALGVLVLGASLHLRFRRDIRAAYEQLERGGSLIAETACGPIEYATLGEGAPVLVVHGIFGGFDQGIMMAQGNLAEGLRSIVPSRFGYLRTPLPDSASPAAQADAHACLLDALGIEQAAVLGTSAGATSAIQFALRFPERCSSLVLFSPNAPGGTEAALPPRAMANVLFRSDFVFWLLTTRFRSSMNSMIGVPKGFKLTSEHRAVVADVMTTVLPVRPRSDGALFDMFVSNPGINAGYPLEDIAVPVLIISAVDDPLALYVNSKAMAERIPDAELLTIESGGHLLLGHDERVKSEIVAFLQEHASAAP